MLFFSILLSVLCTITCEDVEIITSFGRLKGRKDIVSKGGSVVYQFLKIPFAMPPIGDLRFQKPRPHTPLTGLYDATQLGPSCMQPISEENKYYMPNLDISEDCLHLNVYVPKDNSTLLKPVMVFIHGGGWIAGQGTLYDGSILASTGDVIVVTINYRLGFFGFMSTLNDQYPGNYGLFDALEAIKWTKKHIQSFGGDPNEITLFGESAGAFNVLYLATSPLSRGLFQRVIIESGGDLRADAVDPEIKNTTFKVMKAMSCISNSDSSALTSENIQCLLNKDANDILKASLILSTYKVDHATTFKDAFRPCIDGELIPDVPQILLKNKSSSSSLVFNSLDVLHGVNNGDGGLILLYVSAIQNISNFNINNGIPHDVFCNILIPDIVHSYYASSKTVSKAMCGAYSSHDGTGKDSQSVINWFGDFFFDYPTKQVLDTHSKSSTKSTYQYLYSMDSPSRFGGPVPIWFRGANHGDELACVFGMMNSTQSEKKLCHTVMKYWTNFARTGNPNSADLPTWPSYNRVVHVPSCVLGDVIEIVSSFGRLTGRKESTDGGKNTVYQFLKVPYAKPPIGDLRFQKPQPHDPLIGQYDATELGPSCMQTISEENKLFLSSSNVSEDCLHLNIYVPHDISTVSRAVMIWIHGGGWVIGQGTMYDGSILASTGDVIVVTINYRLGFFGFMSTLDDQYPGNYGLYDALEAIRWTKKHISSFGGDPNKITLFGESAGAFNILYLATSPLSKGLFQRVIMESGGDLQSRTLYPDIKNTSFDVMNEVGCINDTYEFPLAGDTVRCLLNVDALEIVKATQKLSLARGPLSPAYQGTFRACIDGELVTDVPEKLLANSSSTSFKVFTSLDVLQGVNNGEGASILGIVASQQNTLNFNLSSGIPLDFFCNLLIPSLTGNAYNSDSQVNRAMCGAYTDVKGSIEQGRAVLNWFGDFIFMYPMQQILDHHSKLSTKSTYQYLFSKTPSYRWSTSLPSWFHGVNHAEELPCVFGLMNFVDNYTQSEERLCNSVVKYWTNFAKFGNPNGGGDELPWWPSYKAMNAYIDLDVPITLHRDLYRNRLVLWDKTIPFLLSHQGGAVQPIG
ncbi:hypothetical protein FSP39_000817 [Pinctada imbricata]|uniref:Carboxylesterase type B domain-containing protein n=1 Tax=Pinctada imbricata TaxID=66713 RepID=A0AA88YAI3_PINIB|nr:hypothetical protein FSP39_000817 [Pinctada imbricata]